MPGRLGLLICGVVLMAAPVWADKGPDAGSLKDSGSGGGSGYAAGGSGVGLKSGMAGMNIHADGMPGAESEKVSFSPSTNFVRASREREVVEIQRIPAVAEPGSLPLILLGLVSVGFLVRRRSEPAKI
jgi:hypothetical protein